MNKSLSCHRSSGRPGFTLVELLVVIGIIAILASVVLSAGNMALKAAMRAKAMNTATQIQTAALGYYTEYSVYPVPAGTAASTDLVIADNDAASWKNLLYGLCGNINPYDSSTTAPSSPVPNSRGIAFLSLKATDVDSNNGPKNPLPPDTTHLYFNIAIDNDYDGILGGTSTSTGKLPNFATGTTTSLTLSGGSSTAGVAVWANCTGKPNNTSCNAGWWVHTY